MNHARSLLIASAIALTFPISSFAAKAVAAPTKDSTFYSVDKSSISRYIQNFKISVNEATGEVSFSGLIPKELKNKIRIEIGERDSARAKDGETPNYPLSIGIEGSTKDTFNSNLTANCSRNQCLDVTTIISLSADAKSVTVKDGKMFLTKSGQIAIRSEDLSRSANDPESIKDEPLASTTFKDADTRTAEEQAAATVKTQELCDIAKSGDVEAINQLRDLNFDSKKLQEYEKVAYQKELEEFKLKLTRASTLSEVDKIVEDINTYAQAPEHEIVKSDAAEALVHAVARLEDLSPTDGKQDKFDNQKFKLAERALKYATKLDPKNEDVRLAYDTMRLEHAKWAAKTGDASIYRSSIAGFNAGYADIARMIRKSENPEAQSLFAEYQTQLNYKMPPQSQWLYYLGINPSLQVYTLDYNYISAATKKLDDQYKAYQQNQQNIQNTIGGQQNQPANSSIFNSGIQAPLSF